MKYEIKKEAGKTVFTLSDQLVAADRSEFDGMANQLFGGAGTLEVDLEGLTFMDSAGLGMLLTLRELAGKSGATVILTHPMGAVKEMLELACFDTLFEIKAA